LTVFVLGWALTSAANASAHYSVLNLQFTYREHISWLPHSFDGHASWFYFSGYLALGCCFWAIRSWLMDGPEADAATGTLRRFPRRLVVLLWVLAINGTLLGLEGLVQRVSGTGKLLWLVQPPVNRDASSQFGPYAYRSNGAQYLNLLLPVTIGFWASLHRRYRRTPRARATHHLLLSCIVVMAACPMLTDSRAAAIVTVGLTVCGAFLLSAGFTDESRLFRGGLSIMAVAALGLGLNIGWETLTKRMQTIEVDYHMREQMYITARAIAKDYPYFGTGPGTFDPVFQMYRSSPDEYWPAQLHNDWLETRITFGGIGFGAILLALLLAAFRWFLPGGIQSSWSFPAFCWLSLAGCLLHARFDFPFQIYSIVFLFVLLCAILSTLSRRPQGQAP
jgi:hypothetical protein